MATHVLTIHFIYLYRFLIGDFLTIDKNLLPLFSSAK